MCMMHAGASEWYTATTCMVPRVPFDNYMIDDVQALRVAAATCISSAYHGSLRSCARDKPNFN